MVLGGNIVVRRTQNLGVSSLILKPTNLSWLLRTVFCNKDLRLLLEWYNQFVEGTYKVLYSREM